MWMVAAGRRVVPRRLCAVHSFARHQMILKFLFKNLKLAFINLNIGW